MQETRLGSLVWEDPLKKEMATHSGILAWEIPWTEEPGRLQFMGPQESDMTEWLSHNIYSSSHWASQLLYWSNKIWTSMKALILLSRVWLSWWTAAHQASLSITNSRSLLKLMSIESVMPSNCLLLSSIFPSIRVFSNEYILHIKWPKYWSFSLSINPSNEYSGLISFRVDWLDLLEVQETLKSLLQHHRYSVKLLYFFPWVFVYILCLFI